MEFVKSNKYIILVIVLLSILMFYFIGQKQGFHEDEIFSYGSSNYKYDNVYRSFGYADANQDVLYNQVLTGNIIDKTKNFILFLTNNESFEKDETLQKEQPIFRTKADALEYLIISKGDVFNYFSVYYNQSIDVHPPLFYFLVHLVSSLFYGSFSKYIIFIINLLFFIGTLVIMCKIMNEINKKELTIPVLILYGASTGAISTVMFQRMYMMLTFFSLLYLYLTFKFIKNDFEITNKITWYITIICGFLTQYYFCFYIVLVFIMLSIYLIIKKEYKKLFNYFKIHLISALIGIIFYPASIYHIFFSYRGIGATDAHTKTFLENILYYFSQIIELFNIKNILFILLGLFVIYIVYRFFKKDSIKVNEKEISNFIILSVPILLYILIISKVSPFLGGYYTSRYIMLTFPVIAIILIYLLSLLFNKHALIITLIFSVTLSVNGFIYNTPVYLYKDYSKSMSLANQNQDKYFIYVYDNYFTHLSSLPEFATYKESLIINDNIYDYASLKDNEKLNSVNEFVLCVKKWLYVDGIVDKIIKNTSFNSYEKVLNIDSDVQSVYYIIKKD